MGPSEDLKDALAGLDVNNVFVYVSDALRWDSLSSRIAHRGPVLKSIAASTHSPSSFTSLLTGLYPPNHGVTSFRNQLQSEIPTLTDLPGYDTRFINSIFAYAEREHNADVDPIYSVLNLDPPKSDHPFEDLEEPFCIIERGPGGHAPYGDFTGTASKYFRQNGAANIKKIREDYSRSVELDANLFIDRMSELREKELIDDTLIIFTSDHGELLGEGGELGHTAPMRPELVYVPTVFIHPELQSFELQDTVFHHVDLLPTIVDLDLLNTEYEFSASIDGWSALNQLQNKPRPCFYNNTVLPDWVPLISGHLHYEGVWDATGGYVNVETPVSERLAVLAGKASASSRRKYILRHLNSSFKSYVNGGSLVYGSPSFQVDKVDQILSDGTNDQENINQIELSPAAEQQLRDLGYK